MATGGARPQLPRMCLLDRRGCVASATGATCATAAALLLAPSLGAQRARASAAPHSPAACDAASPADTLLPDAWPLRSDA